jgi:putative ABC transport system ATP-binding protein
MDLLKELHADGATICMVTHDPRYARYAERTIHLFDGQVVRDEDTRKTEELEQSGFEVHH